MRYGVHVFARNRHSRAFSNQTLDGKTREFRLFNCPHKLFSLSLRFTAWGLPSLRVGYPSIQETLIDEGLKMADRIADTVL
jgi:hypothetical protein